MSYWIELHCDVRMEGRDPNNILRAKCHSHENDNPAIIVKNFQMATLVNNLAKDKGWVHKKGKWICPGCQK